MLSTRYECTECRTERSRSGEYGTRGIHPMTRIELLLGSAALQADAPSWLEETIASVVAFLPRLVGALIILLVGWFVGRLVAKIVARLADAIELDRAVLETPLGEILGGTERAVSNAFGTLAAWFVYAVAILAAANALAIDQLSLWIAQAVTYLPAFIAGLLIIVLGFVVADFIGDAITRTRAATETGYTAWFATGTRLFLYFMVVVIGLDTMGVDVGILFVFARAFAWGLAVALALGAGLAFGLGSRDYVADNVDRWMGGARRSTPTPRSGSSSGTDRSAQSSRTRPSDRSDGSEWENK